MLPMTFQWEDTFGPLLAMVLCICILCVLLMSTIFVAINTQPSGGCLVESKGLKVALGLVRNVVPHAMLCAYLAKARKIGTYPPLVPESTPI